MALEVLKEQEIGYPVVGQEVKYPPNVIDYNINKEQTKDASSITNANNQTTTGLATVIPGLNTLKLRAETSIIGNSGIIKITTASCSVSSTVPSNTYTQFDTITFTGEPGFTSDGGDIYFSNKGTYLISIIYDAQNSYSTSNGLLIRLYHNGSATSICDCTGLPLSDTRVITTVIDSGDYIRIYFKSNHSCDPKATVNFIKLT